MSSAPQCRFRLIDFSKAKTPAARVWALLFDMFIGEQGRIPQIASSFGLSRQQMFVLSWLNSQKPIAMSELADLMGCDASNITGLIDRLEARGLVERQAVLGDRRVKGLALTNKGETLLEQIAELLLEPPIALRELAEDEQHILETLLTKLRTSIELKQK